MLQFFPWMAGAKWSLLWVLITFGSSPECWQTVPTGKVKEGIETIIRNCVLMKKKRVFGACLTQHGVNALDKWPSAEITAVLVSLEIKPVFS